MIIHDLCYLLILKTTMLHNMAPMTGGITNADEHQLVFAFSFFQGLFIPGKPVYRVVCMLQQVRAGFMYECIAVFFYGIHGSKNTEDNFILKGLRRANLLGFGN